MLSPRKSGKRPRAIIVASGPSAKGFIPPDDIPIIAVNGAIDWLSRSDYFFTLDPSPVNLKRLSKPKAGVHYAAAVESDIALPEHVQRYERISKRGPEPARKGSPRWWLWRWSAVTRLSETPGTIHSGNSAWGALGLAWHLGFRDVALVGVDASRSIRIEGGRSKNLSHLPLLFASAKEQIDVVSCGLMRGVPQMTFKEWYD